MCKHHNTILLALATMLMLAPATNAAEVRWITDKLRLSMYETQSPTSTRITTLLSGAKVTILASEGQYSQVKTDEGLTGWVKTAYLDKDIPARTQVETLKRKNTALQKKYEQTYNRLRSLDSGFRQFASSQKKQEQARQQLAKHIKALEESNSELKNKLSSYKGSLPLSWTTGLSLLFLAGGLLGGYYLYDYRARKRHGGFRL